MEEAQQAAAAKPLTLHERIDRFMELLDETEGEFTAEVEQLWESVTAKAEGYAHAFRRLTAEAEQTKALGESYLERAKIKTKRAESLKERLHFMMQAAKLTHIPTPTIDIKVQKNSAPSLVWHVAEAAVPDQYKVEVPAKMVISNEAVKLAINAGEIEHVPDPNNPEKTVPIAELVTGSHIRFR